MRRAILAGLVAPALLAPACGGPGHTRAEPPPLDSADVARAREAAAALGGELMTMLGRELARGGPAAAIAVCADSAQERTRQHQRQGIAVRRVGTRVRNPANAPDSLEAAILASFAAALAEGRWPPDTALVQPAPAGGYELRYLRPIRVQALCLGCHGPPDALDTAVRQALAARYPADQATGYAEGELRGAVSVRLSLPTTSGR
jgi:hypothetical protein